MLKIWYISFYVRIILCCKRIHYPAQHVLSKKKATVPGFGCWDVTRQMHNKKKRTCGCHRKTKRIYDRIKKKKQEYSNGMENWHREITFYDCVFAYLRPVSICACLSTLLPGHLINYTQDLFAYPLCELNAMENVGIQLHLHARGNCCCYIYMQIDVENTNIVIFFSYLKKWPSLAFTSLIVPFFSVGFFFLFRTTFFAVVFVWPCMATEKRNKKMWPVRYEH